jgi:hypothetical protein
MSAFIAPLRGPLLALVSSLIGAGLAWAWFAYPDSRVIPLATAGVVLVWALGQQAYGKSQLPSRPVKAVDAMNRMTPALIALTAVAAAAGIVATVALAAPDTASTETTELLAALTAAVTTFLTGAVLAQDKSDEAVAGLVRDRFYAAYGGIDPAEAGDERYVERGGKYLLPRNSDGWNAVYSEGWHGLVGWGSEARKSRAQELQSYLDTATEEVSRTQAAASTAE